jgi:choline dehydrogenase-like flavoprotein
MMRAADANKVWTQGKGRTNRRSGGTRMGANPRNSVMNEYCQTHDVPSLFTSAFPTMWSYPPTATIAALSYRTAEYILRPWFALRKLSLDFGPALVVEVNSFSCCKQRDACTCNSVHPGAGAGRNRYSA